MSSNQRSGLSARRRALFAALLLLPTGVAAVVAGCGDDDDVTVTPSRDGGATDTVVRETAAPEANGVDAGDGGPSAAQIARGRYLVDHVSVCGDCHTPRLPSGAPDLTRYLAGVDCFIDANGAADGGCLSSANLTNDATGLSLFTDAQIKTMFMNGVRPDGRNLVNVMPYYVFHNMTAADADAIVAFLRTVPPVAHAERPNEPPFVNIPDAAVPIDPNLIPLTDGGVAAQRGRYLAAMAGVCLECHTPELPQGAATPIDMTKPFGGNRPFVTASLGLPSPPFPETIYSANVTPDPTGLVGWTIADFQRVLKQGRDRGDSGVCPPMPVGPMGAYGGLTDQDALDIATYIAGLPPVSNAVTNGNAACAAP